MTDESVSLDKLHTAKQTADYLHVKDQTLAKWRCNKTVDLPFVKISGKILYRASDIEFFIENNLRH